MQGWKTLSFAVIVAILGVLQGFDWLHMVSQQTAGIITTVVGVLMATLRYFQTQPKVFKVSRDGLTEPDHHGW